VGAGEHAGATVGADERLPLSRHPKGKKDGGGGGIRRAWVEEVAGVSGLVREESSVTPQIMYFDSAGDGEQSREGTGRRGL